MGTRSTRTAGQRRPVDGDVLALAHFTIVAGAARVITDADLAWYYRAQAAQWRAQAKKATRDKKLAMLKIADGFAALAVIVENSSGESHPPFTPARLNLRRYFRNWRHLE